MEEILTNWWSLLEEETTQALELYKSSGTIESFHTVLNDGLNKGTEITISVTIEKRTLTFDIFKAKDESTNLDILRKGTVFSFLIPKGTTADEICLEIFICFNQIQEEYEFEMLFCLLFNNGLHVEPATLDENLMKAIDVKVHGKKGIMPLQLKISLSGQFEHRKNYPDIPSLVYTDKSDKSWVQKWTNILYDAYFSEPRMILHKNSLEAPPK